MQLPGFLSRLTGQRWTLAAIGLVLFILWNSGRLHTPEAVAAVIFILSVAFILRPASASRRIVVSSDRQRPGAWPESPLVQLIDALPHPAVLIDRKLIVRHANEQATRILSVPRPGDPLAFRLRWPDLISALESCRKDGTPQRIEVKDNTPDERWFDVHVRPYRDNADGPMRFMLLVAEDKTEERRVEQMRVDFIANASHELRTPLAALTGFIETLMGAGRDDPEARHRFLALMRAQAGRMARLIDDLLSLNRIEMRAHVAPSGTVDLAGLVCETLALLEPLARADAVRFDVQVPETPVHVRGARDELIQVVTNLVDNAIKYGGPDKTVTISVQTPKRSDGGCYAELAVTDEGPGIAAEHLPRLTERFYRVDVGESRSRGGTGLGLAIVKHIALRHRSRLHIASAPGKGARFSLQLECRDCETGEIVRNVENQDVELSQN
ncbi:MAG: two-component sensor histidine kinase [Hyphomicrobiaceae bacterium]|nr:two-component sensor histidine kinase [Hyphomicrobiaceae bacterium]